MLASSVLTQEAHKALEDAILYYRGKLIETVAACDPDANAIAKKLENIRPGRSRLSSLPQNY
jgi:hypothetical protein